MKPNDAVRLGKWLEAYDPGFFAYVAQHMAINDGSAVMGLGAVAPAAASPSIWEKISGGAANLANTVTSLADSYYGYKSNRAIVKAAVKQAEASAPIEAANRAPAEIPGAVKSTKAIADELWPYVAFAGLFTVTLLLVKGKKGR